MTLRDFDKLFDTAEGATAVVIGKYLYDSLWSLLAPQARFVDSTPCKYPTYNGMDLIMDARNPDRFEPIFGVINMPS